MTRKENFTPIHNKKIENSTTKTTEDLPVFLRDCKAIKRVAISNYKENKLTYAERVLGWKIKSIK